MFPDRCSVKQNGRDCVNPPEYVVEIVHNDDSYMVGITCEKHKDVVAVKIEIYKLYIHSLNKKSCFFLKTHYKFYFDAALI